MNCENCGIVLRNRTIYRKDGRVHSGKGQRASDLDIWSGTIPGYQIDAL